MNNFEFNECGVCTNPIIVYERNKGEWKVVASIAQSPNGKWDFGYSVSYDTGGFSVPILLLHGNKGYSEDEAKLRALTEIEKHIRQIGGKEMANIIVEELQPTLF